MTIYLFGTNGILDNYIKAFLLHKNVDCVCITRNDVDASIVAAEKLFLVNLRTHITNWFRITN